MFDDPCTSSDVRFAADFSDDPEHFLIRQLKHNSQLITVRCSDQTTNISCNNKELYNSRLVAWRSTNALCMINKVTQQKRFLMQE